MEQQEYHTLTPVELIAKYEQSKHLHCTHIKELSWVKPRPSDIISHKVNS